MAFVSLYDCRSQHAMTHERSGGGKRKVGGG